MITEPVEYDEETKAIVAAFDALADDAKDAKYWGEDAVKKLRSLVKTHYIKAQKNRCCYCNRHTPSENHNLWNGEHVVPRVLHPGFMFDPKNLAVSCLDCNNSKADKETLINKNLKNYPSNSSAFKILHPHFDDFDDHIFVHRFVYIGKTKKGRETIYMCDMLRYGTKYIDWDNSAADSRFEADVDAVFDETPQSIAVVQAVIDQLPEV